MKWILIAAMLGLAGCSSKVIVKNCKSYIGDYQKCELVE